MELVRDNLFELLSMVGLLLLSGVFSGSETALFSLSTPEVNRIRRRGGSTGEAVLFLRNRLPEFLLTVLFGNNVVNILFFAIGSELTVDISRQHGSGAGAGFGICCLLAIIVFGEVIPKSAAAAASYHFSLLAGLPMALLHRLIAPVRAVLKTVIHYIERVCNISVNPEDSGEELKLLFELGQSKGVISADESSLLRAVVDLPQVRAGEIMTPRVDTASVCFSARREELLRVARQAGHSKIPVRELHGEEYIGWVDAREAFFNLKKNESINKIMRKALMLSEFDRGDQIFHRFMESHNGLAVVFDERGATAGIMVLADLAAEIFGELGDEDRKPRESIRRENEDVYIVDGGVSVRELRNLCGLIPEHPGINSVGGLVASLLGRTARVGDIIETGGVKLSVLTLRKKRVGEVRVDLPRATARADGESE